MQMDAATILIVEDEPVLREVNARWMAQTGCRVLTAENGADALNILKANHVNLVITDLHMPVMDGISLVKDIHANGHRMPKVIVVSGDAFALDGHELPVAGMLYKPYERHDLVNLVQQTLAGDELRTAMKRILIVEDNASSRELLRTVLEQLGHLVVEASDGGDALLKLRERIPDLIFLDLKIPPPNGYEVLKEVRRNVLSSAVPVVALTAQAMVGDREKALAAGFNEYLTKPIALARLRSEVERLLAL